MSFKVGDVVKLKSDGPKMTIQSLRGDMVDCVWFGPDGNVKHSSFPAEALEKREVVR
jgi:uncharacterized protein YodC (DUF2158 family)